MPDTSSLFYKKIGQYENDVTLLAIIFSNGTWRYGDYDFCVLSISSWLRDVHATCHMSEFGYSGKGQQVSTQEYVVWNEDFIITMMS